MVDVYLPYAGIGSRETPPEAISSIKVLALTLAEMGFTLRSGGAPGADEAFEQGANIVYGKKEIYLPWKGFNGNRSALYTVCDSAKQIASQNHPAWSHMKDPVRLLHSRNVYQVLGQSLDVPSLFTVCWTQDAIEHASKRSNKTGGTGQAISISTGYDVPIFNLKNENALTRIMDFAELQLKQNVTASVKC